MSFDKGWLASLALVVLSAGSSSARAQEPVQEEPNAFFTTPEWLGQKSVSDADWARLEPLVESLSASGERNIDGKFQLHLLTEGIAEWLVGEEADQDLRDELAKYKEQFPKSAFWPILEAMEAHAAAWRARGGGFSSTVTPEGWSFFRERNKNAWQLIRAAKSRSDRLPTWYEEAISIGMDANVSDEELRALFEEGIAKFPGYHPIYFSYARQFSPRWGGNYEDADAFIREQVAARTNPDGEVLYTRLYWLIDQNNGEDTDFFEESLVDWSRMRTGFELLLKSFPKSNWNRANFGVYACRAGDAATFLKLRPSLEPISFRSAAPEGLSLEVCDARFIKKT
jgi:hypothetical protein